MSERKIAIVCYVLAGAATISLARIAYLITQMYLRGEL